VRVETTRASVIAKRRVRLAAEELRAVVGLQPAAEPRPQLTRAAAGRVEMKARALAPQASPAGAQRALAPK